MTLSTVKDQGCILIDSAEQVTNSRLFQTGAGSRCISVIAGNQSLSLCDSSLSQMWYDLVCAGAHHYWMGRSGHNGFAWLAMDFPSDGEIGSEYGINWIQDHANGLVETLQMHWDGGRKLGTNSDLRVMERQQFPRSLYFRKFSHSG
jgi:hypothetical protein